MIADDMGVGLSARSSYQGTLLSPHSVGGLGTRKQAHTNPTTAKFDFCLLSFHAHN